MRSLPLRLFPLLLPVCAALPVLGASTDAHAQATGAVTMTLSQTITRTPDISRPSGLLTTDVGAADCSGNVTLGFSVVFTGALTYGYQLHAYTGIGQDCTVLTNRQGGTQTCWEVAAAQGSLLQTTSVNVRIQDLISQLTSTTKVAFTPGIGNAQSCTTAANANLGPQGMALYFLYTDGGGNVQASATVNLNVSMSGPPAPSSMSAGEGDRVALVGWTLPTGTSSITGVNVYCAPVDQVHSVTDAGSTDGGGTDAGPVDAGSTLVCDGGFADGGVDDAGNPIDGGFVDGGCTSVPNDTDGGGGGGGGDCPTPSLDQLHVCGTANGQTATQATVKNLINGTDYVFAVAAVDRFGSPGGLSNFACATPGPVADFLHNYRSDGGLAGGCALEDAPVGGGALAGGLATLGIALLRRRKGKRS